jgi:hypothetical protein
MNKIPKLLIENGLVKLDGKFDFKINDGVIKDNNTEDYYKIISFKFNPECDANIEKSLSQDKINEIIGENLKKDFINFIKNK